MYDWIYGVLLCIVPLGIVVGIYHGRIKKLNKDHKLRISLQIRLLDQIMAMRPSIDREKMLKEYAEDLRLSTM